jgi:hypothetical protein
MGLRHPGARSRLSVARRPDRPARSRIETAMAARGEGYSACNHALLAQVGSLHFDPLLEEIALRSLTDDDPDDPEVAANAAGFLGRFGSLATEERLWDLLAQWSARWLGRESELTYMPGGTNSNLYQGTLGNSLQQAIASGQAWLADKPKLQKLQQLSVGSSMRQEIDGILAQWDNKPWHILFVPGSDARFDVLQYNLNWLDSLEKKLSQFPSGSSFVWSDASAGSSPDAAIPLPQGARNVPAQRNGSLTFPRIFPPWAYTQQCRGPC